MNLHLQQLAHAHLAAVVRCDIQWRGPALLRSVDIGARLQQLAHARLVALLYCDEQWRGPVDTRQADPLKNGFWRSNGVFKGLFMLEKGVWYRNPCHTHQ